MCHRQLAQFCTNHVCISPPGRHIKAVRVCHGSCAVQVSDASTGRCTATSWATPGCSTIVFYTKNSTLIYNTSGNTTLLNMYTIVLVQPFTPTRYYRCRYAYTQPLCMVSTDSSDTANAIIWEKANKASASKLLLFGCSYYDSTTIIYWV